MRGWSPAKVLYLAVAGTTLLWLGRQWRAIAEPFLPPATNQTANASAGFDFSAERLRAERTNHLVGTLGEVSLFPDPASPFVSEKFAEVQSVGETAAAMREFHRLSQRLNAAERAANPELRVQQFGELRTELVSGMAWPGRDRLIALADQRGKLWNNVVLAAALAAKAEKELESKSFVKCAATCDEFQKVVKLLPDSEELRPAMRRVETVATTAAVLAPAAAELAEIEKSADEKTRAQALREFVQRHEAELRRVAPYGPELVQTAQASFDESRLRLLLGPPFADASKSLTVRLSQAKTVLTSVSHSRPRETAATLLQQRLHEVLAEKKPPLTLGSDIRETVSTENKRVVVGLYDKWNNGSDLFAFWDSTKERLENPTPQLLVTAQPDFSPEITHLDVKSVKVRVRRVTEAPKPPFVIRGPKEFNEAAAATVRDEKLFSAEAWRNLLAVVDRLESEADGYRKVAAAKDRIYSKYDGPALLTAYQEISFANEQRAVREVCENFPAIVELWTLARQ